jgi:parvulin-like peptidyl-prolyl isomerase
LILKRFFREPLLHFLIAGGILFGIFRVTHPAAPDPAGKTIVVDKDTLLTFLQFRSKAFKPDYFASQLEAMSPKERQDLVDQYVEEEALYREAKTLGLEQGDDVIRQRLVQKMRYLMDDLAQSGPPTDAVLQQYLEKNKDLYIIAPSVTFTHVFADSSVRGDKGARELAEQLKIRLYATHAAFNDAPQFGDRFPFLQNYVERTFDFVESHFGPDFASEVKQIAPADGRWIGPIKSAYGYHLVLVTARTGARLPQLHEIRTQVEEDWTRDWMDTARAQSVRHVVGQYMIERKDLGGKHPQ